MNKEQIYQWASPLVHAPSKAHFIDENRQRLGELFAEWPNLQPSDRFVASGTLLGVIYDYGDDLRTPVTTQPDRRGHLRRVTFERYVVLAGRPCTDDPWVKREGWFHRWADTYEEFAAGPAQHTMALVEGDDGRPYFVHPEKLQFITPTPTLP